MQPTSRRSFLRVAAGTTALAGGGWGFLRELPAVRADETQPDPRLVRLDSGIEPLVRLLETTPRDRLLEEVASRIHGGVSYREVLAALMLAAVRNVQPRPAVGFKFHAVLVINSAHLASQAAPDADRWLPIFWALDYYKGRQLEEERASGWKMPPVDDESLPRPSQAREALVTALEQWDVEGADRAVAALSRSAGASDIFQLMYRYGIRDYRSIGHKAIFVANSWRTLQCIGWHHAEPVLRSLVCALLNHEGEANPAQSDHDADRDWRQNQERVLALGDTWQDGKPSAEATRELLAVLHDGTPQQAADAAVEMLGRGVQPQSLWDALLVSAGELLMRQPGIIGLHALTATNAMRYAYEFAADAQTRQLALLQNCAFLPRFRQSAEGRGRVKEVSFEEVQLTDWSPASSEEAVEQIMAEISNSPAQAARQVRTYLQHGGSAHQLMDAARRMVFLKGRDAHDYKFSSAVLEDYYHVSPSWRDVFLALSVFNLRGAGDRDSEIVARLQGLRL